MKFPVVMTLSLPVRFLVGSRIFGQIDAPAHPLARPHPTLSPQPKLEVCHLDASKLSNLSKKPKQKCWHLLATTAKNGAWVQLCMLQCLFFQGKTWLFHEFLLNLHKGNKASLPETPTKSSQRIQNTIFIVFNFMLHSLCFRFEHIHHNTGLPQFPRAICGDYPPEPKILSRLESRGSVVLAGGFCVSFWMFIDVYCQSLHNAPHFFCLVSLACDQHRLKYWPKKHV